MVSDQMSDKRTKSALTSMNVHLVEINVQTAVVQIWLVLINASVILDSKRLKIKKDVSTLTSVIWKMYVRMDSVEIPRDHTNVTAIQVSSSTVKQADAKISTNV